ncbi:MAG: glutamyl-tRNA reductase [Actinomycetota bacterium]|nr:glutamyl-tRNA reductase [Actinomycetota bacterium]
MSVLVVGLNHRSADFALLDRLAMPVDEHPKALRALVGLNHVLEAAVLSTCNRVEVYAHVSRFHAGLHEVLTWLASRADIDPHVLEMAHYTYYDDRAAAHLFAVASGIDSLIIGERQIALQVSQAGTVAREEGASGRVLRRLFDHAVHVSRRARAETDIARGASSIVDVGLDVAARRWDGSLAGRTVLVIGAGTIGALTGARLVREGAARVLIRNRSTEKADRLAARLGGETVSEGGLGDALVAADLVVCCSGASMPLIDVDLVAETVRRRGDHDARPLVLLDLSMPRNVEMACGNLPGVTLVDLDAVRAVADTTVTGRTVDAVRAIVEEEAGRFHAWLRAARIEPTIRALRERAEKVRASELGRLAGRLASLEPREREAVEAVTRGIVNTLLHDPTVRLKGLVDKGGAEHYAVALRELFDLDE